MPEYRPYNPLDKQSLGISVADKLIEQDLHPLPPDLKFDGAGVYALYYFGHSELYKPLAEIIQPQPIYVGKAVPAGSRKGSKLTTVNPGPQLYKRLREHARSIDETENLDVADFKCRYLAVDDIWIPLGESLLIKKFNPVWNTVVEGFGIHTPGGGRKKQQRSPWDELHPGRCFARDLPANKRGRDYYAMRIKEALSKIG